jgi:protein SCO1
VKLLLWFIIMAVLSASARAQTSQPALLDDVGIDQKLGAQVPADLIFTDDLGRTVRLGDYFGQRPLILSLVYYECPMLCTMSLNDLTRAMAAMPLNPGQDFEIITVSFDPREGTELAAAKKRRYVNHYKKSGAANAWHFLTGDETNIRRLTDSVGFRYAWDAKFNQYAHAAGFIVLTPDGKAARYFYGVDYSSKDMRLALVEASQGKISRPVEKVILYCFTYDPATGKYSLAILRLLRVAGLLTVAAIVSFVALNVWRERRARAAQSPLEAA